MGKTRKPSFWIWAVATLALASNVSAQPVLDLSWDVVVNDSFEIPDNPGRFYNSYNPPSVNSNALVVFRARSTGQQAGPVSGIYTRDMAMLGPIQKIADRNTVVPEPNNTCYPVPGPSDAVGLSPCTSGETLSSFNEFPSFPRIAITQDTVATRGNHPPVWTYGETRAGTTGVYVNQHASGPFGSLVTGASLLGAVSEFSDLFAVPGVDPLTRFDVFPGAPAITDDGIIAFKGNYSAPSPGPAAARKTGVFYRQVDEAPTGGDAAIQLIASSDTVIPNPGNCPVGTTFGSTAPPSAAGDQVVFVGFDDEANPTCGGVYQASLAGPPEQLTTLVGLDTRVPGQGRNTFTGLGEGLSFDGRLVGFWGAWGGETKTVRLYCPTEGNRIRRLFCNHIPDPETGEVPGGGDPNSICDDTTDPLYPMGICYQEKEVPVNQGIFVYDSMSAGRPQLRTLARTGRGRWFDDFVYWNYSGAPPGAEEGEGEPPRFRASAFLSVSAWNTATTFIRVAFLARTAHVDPVTHVYVDPRDGIYLAMGPGAGPTLTLIETGMDGTRLDPDAVWNDDGDPGTPEVPLPVASLAMERDAFRGDWLAIAATMGEEEAGWAGIYLVDLSTR
ncbi:MAG: hypothetical protein WAU39_04200 [Polyangiales bacterium]